MFAMYWMLFLVAFTVAAPPQYVDPQFNPDYEPSYDDIGVEEVPPQEEFDLVLHRVARQVPKCYWAGTAPFCVGLCPEGWKPVSHDASGDGYTCWTGKKAYCCPSSPYSIAASYFSK